MQATPDRACAEGVEAADVEALPPLPTFKPQCYIQHSSRDMAANKDMAAWKMIGYPGMRADYIDWIGVRNKAYPLPPVDLAGRRG